MAHLIKGYYCDVSSRKEYPIRAMNADETLERLEMNIGNTTSKLRAHVIAELAKANGHGSMS